jgi:hypothetical protein
VVAKVVTKTPVEQVALVVVVAEVVCLVVENPEIKVPTQEIKVETQEEIVKLAITSKIGLLPRPILLYIRHKIYINKLQRSIIVT